jgi:hypothetical protein
MSRTRVDETDASITLAGGGTWNGIADNPSYNATLHYNVGAGATFRAVPPAATTCAFLIGCTRNDGPTAVTITVDGVQVATWNLNTGCLSADYRYYWYRSISPPIFLDGLSSHTILATSAGGTFTADGAEYFVAEAATAGRLTSWGHSWPHGYTLGTPATQRFGALIAAALGMTEDNQGVDNADLTNGTINAAGAVSDVQTVAAVGATSGTFQLSVTANGSTQTTPAQNWNVSAATLLAAIQGLSNVGAAQVAIASGTAVNTGSGVALTWQGNLAGIYVPTMAITATSVAGATLTVAQTTAGQPTNPQYASQGNQMPAWMLAELSNTLGLTWTQKPALFVAMHGTNDLGNWLNYDNGNGGLGIPAAGAGYSRRRLTQRMREAFWRVRANTPTAELWAMTQPPPLSADTVANRPIYADINAGILAAAYDATVGASVVECANLLGVQNGGALLYTTDHPNATGHRILANGFIDVYRRAHPEKYGRAAMAVY